MDKNLFTLDALAKKSGYWVGSLGRWIREGRLTEHRVNGKKAIDYEEFVNFLTKNNIKKPYKKGPRSKVIPQEMKVETIKAKSVESTEEIKPIKVIQKEVLIDSLYKALDVSRNNHLLTPYQFMVIQDILNQLKEGEK
jgi:hypothetical protein